MEELFSKFLQLVEDYSNKKLFNELLNSSFYFQDASTYLKEIKPFFNEFLNQLNFQTSYQMSTFLFDYSTNFVDEYKKLISNVVSVHIVEQYFGDENVEEEIPQDIINSNHGTSSLDSNQEMRQFHSTEMENIQIASNVDAIEEENTILQNLIELSAINIPELQNQRSLQRENFQIASTPNMAIVDEKNTVEQNLIERSAINIPELQNQSSLQEENLRIASTSNDVSRRSNVNENIPRKKRVHGYFRKKPAPIVRLNHPIDNRILLDEPDFELNEFNVIVDSQFELTIDDNDLLQIPITNEILELPINNEILELPINNDNDNRNNNQDDNLNNNQDDNRNNNQDDNLNNNQQQNNCSHNGIPTSVFYRQINDRTENNQIENVTNNNDEVVRNLNQSGSTFQNVEYYFEMFKNLALAQVNEEPQRSLITRRDRGKAFAYRKRKAKNTNLISIQPMSNAIARPMFLENHLAEPNLDEFTDWINSFKSYESYEHLARRDLSFQINSLNREATYIFADLLKSIIFSKDRIIDNRFIMPDEITENEMSMRKRTLKCLTDMQICQVLNEDADDEMTVTLTHKMNN